MIFAQFEVSAVNHMSSLMSEQWQAVNYLSIVMGEQRKKGENSCTTAALKQHTPVIFFFSHHFWQVIDRQRKLTSNVTICDLWLLFEVSKVIDWFQISVLTNSAILPYHT